MHRALATLRPHGHNGAVKSYPTARGVVLRKHSGASERASPSPARPDGPARVRVAREVAGRGGKAVSVVLGLPLAAAELETLARELKKLCGAGGAVRDGRIEIQGEHRDRLVEALRERGYEAKRAGG
jgi:translation initiation factor 1